MNTENITELDKITKTFFSSFNNINNEKVDLTNLYSLFIDEAIIVKNCVNPEIYALETFIKPREVLLNSGELINFSEFEIKNETKIFGNIAQRFCSYKKMGELNGEYFKSFGMKTIQFIKTADGWKISSVAWDDEKENLKLPKDFQE